MSRWAKWRGDPLVAFLVIGAALYGAQLAVGPAPAVAPDVIEITPSLLDDLRDRYRTTFDAEPTDDDLARLVERWIDEEILVREALARGLERDDAIIRARLAEKMGFVLEAREVPDEPSIDDLEAMLAANPDDYTVAGRVTFRQLLVGRDGDSAHRAVGLRARLVAGESLESVADGLPEPPGGPVLRGRTHERLVELFGDELAETVTSATPGEWLSVTSPHGVHLVRVEERTDTRTLTFEEAHQRLVARWQRERAAEAAAHALAILRSRHEVRGWPR